MKPLSLKTRISLCIAFLTAVVVCILSGVAYYEFKEATWRSMDTTLLANLNQIQSIITSDESDIREKESEIRRLMESLIFFEKVKYRIWIEKGNYGLFDLLMISDAGEIYIKASNQTPAPGQTVLYDVTEDGKTFRAVWGRYDQTISAKLPGRINIIAAISSKQAYHELGEFVRLMVIVSAIVVWASFGLTQQIVRWGLRPIDMLAEQMQLLSEKKMEPVFSPSFLAYKELHTFIDSWRAMLARLDAAIQEQKRFTADAAHELKTPVSLIKSTLQLAVSRQRTADDYKQAITDSLEDIERLNHLISQLLDLSRLESGLPLEPLEKINLKEILEEVILRQLEPLESKHFTLRQSLCDAEVLGRRLQLHQLFSNLLDNAIKYAPAATVITVAMTVEDQTVCTTLHDQGGGILPQERTQIFKRFYRSAQPHKSDVVGSGLGLAIAQEIATQHLGGIDVASDSNKGTLFTVRLPRYGAKKMPV